MSAIPPITASDTASAARQARSAARDAAGESSTPAANRGAADRFRPDSGVVRVKQDASQIAYDPSKPFGASNGLIISPNAGIAAQAVGRKSHGYGLAFNSPVMHLYKQAGDTQVDILA